MLDTIRWERVCELVDHALALPPDARSRLLQQEEPDAEVRAEAASLLAAHGSAGDTFLAGDVVSEGLIGELPSPWAGRRIGAYRVLEEIGQGGMGIVLLAARADDLYERRVAIKIVRADLTGDVFLRRFRREIRILASFDHPGIARLLDAGITEDGAPFLVMEFVDGTPIDQFCREKGCSPEQVLRLVTEVAEAVSYAHRLSVVHRDIKPGNILVTAEGRPKLLDFGIAKLPAEALDENSMQTELRAWTPAFASPEQLAGGPVTTQSDVFSLGVLLYVLLTGKPPYRFAGLTAAQMERAFETTTPLTPSQVAAPERQPMALLCADPVVLKALRVSPSARYPTAAEFTEDLRHASAGERTVAQMPSSGERAFRWVRRRRRSMLAAAAGVAIVITGAVMSPSLRRLNRPQQPGLVELRPSVAILPFQNRNKAPSAKWISAAASEIVATELAAGDQIRVAGPQDVQQAAQDLHVADAQQDESSPAIAGVARNVDARYVLSGSYAHPEGSPERSLRFDVALFDAERDQVLLRRSFVSAEDQVGDAAGQIARSVLTAIGRGSQAARIAAERTLPHNPEALRGYSEGQSDLRSLNFMEARAKLERAAAAEESSPMIHSALAEAWSGLGYELKARAEADRAAQLSAGLPKQAKLTIQGQAMEMKRDWKGAVETFGMLHEFFPDDIEYGLHLARDQAAAQHVDDALATLAAMKELPPPFRDDPRVPLQEARIANEASRPKVGGAAADRALALARQRGAVHMAAQAQLARAAALDQTARDLEAIAAAESALYAFRETGDQRSQARALNSIGSYRSSLGQYDSAIKALTEAKRRFVEVGDIRGLANTLNNLGTVAQLRGQNDSAKAFYSESLRLNQQSGDAGRSAIALNNIAIAEKALYHLDRARACYEASYQLSKSTGNWGAMAMARTNLASILRRQGKLDEARASDEEALSINRQFGLTATVSYSLQGLARTALWSGNLVLAHDLFRQAIELNRQYAYRSQLAYALCNTAEVYGLMGDKRAQLAALDEGIRIRMELGESVNLADCQMDRIKEDLHSGSLSGRREALEQIISVSSNSAVLAQAHALLAEVEARTGQPKGANHELREAQFQLAMVKGASELNWELTIMKSSLIRRGLIRGDATSQLRFAEREARRLRDKPWQLRISLEVAEDELHRGSADARKHLQQVAQAAHAIGAEGIVAMALQDLGQPANRQTV